MIIRDLFRRTPNGWYLLHDIGVQFPEDVHQLLTADFYPEYHWYLRGHVAETLAAFAVLNVPQQSELTHLYVNYGPLTVVGWYELNDVDSLADWTEYARNELEVPDKYIALTSIEGQGIDLYDRLSGAVYDVEFGQFEALAAGELEPVADSISGFIRWCEKH